MTDVPVPRRLKDGRIDLPEITLIAVTSVALAATVRALNICRAQARFATVKLLTDKAVDESDLDGMQRIEIQPLASRAAYSHFMIKEIGAYVDTPFALCIQWDGYILDASRWNESFLACDYIGAPWPQFDDGRTVGNGGFSLRSRRLLDACRDPRITVDDAEDVLIGRRYRTLLEEDHGVRFASEDLAYTFAFERERRQEATFGFHGVFNLVNSMDEAAFAALYRQLEYDLVGRREQRDLIELGIRNQSYELLSAVLGCHFIRPSRLPAAYCLLRDFIRARYQRKRMMSRI